MHDPRSDMLEPPLFGPQLPVYPPLIQFVRVTGSSVGQNTYPCVVQQSNGNSPTSRDREIAWVGEPNGNFLQTGTIYMVRLVGSFTNAGLTAPLYKTVVTATIAQQPITVIQGVTINNGMIEFLCTTLYLIGNVFVPGVPYVCAEFPWCCGGGSSTITPVTGWYCVRNPDGTYEDDPCQDLTAEEASRLVGAGYIVTAFDDLPDCLMDCGPGGSGGSSVPPTPPLLPYIACLYFNPNAPGQYTPELIAGPYYTGVGGFQCLIIEEEGQIEELIADGYIVRNTYILGADCISNCILSWYCIKSTIAYPDFPIGTNCYLLSIAQAAPISQGLVPGLTNVTGYNTYTLAECQGGCGGGSTSSVSTPIISVPCCPDNLLPVLLHATVVAGYTGGFSGLPTSIPLTYTPSNSINGQGGFTYGGWVSPCYYDTGISVPPNGAFYLIFFCDGTTWYMSICGINLAIVNDFSCSSLTWNFSQADLGTTLLALNCQPTTGACIPSSGTGFNFTNGVEVSV